MKSLINHLFGALLLPLFVSFFIPTDPIIQFLHALNPDQRDKITLAFEDASKSTWHFIPSSMWARPGIPLGVLNRNQKDLFFEMLHQALSETGYTKTMKIIGLENVLLEMSGDSVMRDPDKYFIAIYGNPEIDSLWSWRFEGHHISLNFTILNGKTSVAPRFFGANPAVIPSGPRKGERTLDREEDLGFDLIHSMTGEQQQKAIFQEQPFYEIVTSNSPEISPMDPVGISFAELNKSQQAILLELIQEYLSSMPKHLAMERMANLQTEELDAIRFGWAGGTHAGEGHYYRVQGKTFLIEFDNTQNNANHIHSVWRDFTGDFGRDLIRLHYLHSNHQRN
ncbi:MAG: DUF3500 domain-containing protein [Saprospiraceae bacterium]|nr:DUF3500 domain-containing protein [Saprospiraceae bacterium]